VTGESSARAALYISAVSSTLVALGFIGQISEVGDGFNVFALTALPTLYVLGDALGVMKNMGVSLERRQQYFTTGSMIAVINSVVGGAAVAIAVGAITSAPLGICAGTGGIAAIVSLVWLLRIENRMYHDLGGFSEAWFPSPEAEQVGASPRR
jgi:hypothetical protein